MDKINLLSSEINSIINGDRDLKNYKPPSELEDFLQQDNKELGELKKQENSGDSSQPLDKPKKPSQAEESASRLPPVCREGDGIKFQEYQMYCTHCRLEYMVQMDSCTSCKKALITNEQRNAELMNRVEQYKAEKRNRKIKRGNWENWKKTQEIVYDKYSINNKKWDYFYDEDSDEELEKKEKENPMTPTNDPNFKAMEVDIEQRAKRIADKRAKAEEFKKEGNNLLKKKRYQEAADQYTEAINLIKDSKVYYTNRALAYLKLEKYEEVVKDCSECLEIAEFLNDGIQANYDVCFKAYSRRAMAHKELLNLELAKKDIESAIQLIDDKEAKRLLEQINDQMKTSTILYDIKYIEKHFEALTKDSDKGIDHIVNNFDLDKFYAMVNGEKGAKSDMNAKDLEYLKQNGPMLVLKILLERLRQKKEYNIFSKEDLKIIREIHHKYNTKAIEQEKFLRYLISIDFYNYIISSIEYCCTTKKKNQPIEENVKLLDELIVEDYTFDILTKSKLILMVGKVFEYDRISKDYKFYGVNILYKFIENKAVRAYALDSTEKINSVLKVVCLVLEKNDSYKAGGICLSIITNMCVLYKEQTFRYLLNKKELVYTNIKSKIKTSGNNFEEGNVEMNETVFHVLASLAINEQFRAIIKNDKPLLKSIINELQIENLIKLEGYETRMNKILICLNNLLYGDNEGTLSALLMTTDKKVKTENLNVLGTCESILINKGLNEETLVRTFSVLSSLIKNSHEIFIEKLFVRYSLPNTILNYVIESDNWEVLDSVARILCRSAKFDEFYKFIRHDIAKDLQRDNEAINKLLKSFNAEEQDEMVRGKETDSINPIEKLTSYMKKCVKFVPGLKEGSSQYNCIYNSATLINTLSDKDPALLDNFTWVVQHVIMIIKECTGKMRKNYAVCLSKMTVNSKCYDQYKEHKGLEVLQSVKQYLN